jgi:small subunit ribosomal protein S6
LRANLFFNQNVIDYMRHYEVTFIVDPVLSGDELKSTAQAYVDMIQGDGFTIVHVDEMGLRPLAYPINKRHSGVYFSIEFSGEVSSFIDLLELALRRDERIMRFLTVSLDKFGVKYNEDKRNGLIGKSKKVKASAPATPVAAPVAAAPVAAASVAAAPVVETPAAVVAEEAPVAPAPAPVEAVSAATEAVAPEPVAISEEE